MGTDIPHKSSVADEISKKGEYLDTVDFDLVQVCSYLISLYSRFLTASYLV
jgi:hypothetical protein